LPRKKLSDKDLENLILFKIEKELVFCEIEIFVQGNHDQDPKAA